ncbi:MAG: 30S ribosomal protein S20 [Acidobacteria bacterium]|nr:30S ribosomal protein S20 [Acidobacteriota bacterium]MBI3656875.1 30S ribosomal protein S20 [Acidobacteriota bacterium]
MAKRHKSALKANRHSEKRRLINKGNKSRLRTALKAIRVKIEDGLVAEARSALPQLYSVLDKMIQKGVIHENAVARYKSRLTKQILKQIPSTTSATPTSSANPPAV